jgi:hypothetical protein
MAHFIKIQDNICIGPVIVVNNEVITDENGIEQEQLGIDFCKSLYGENTEWLQTSYNGNFRGRYAAPGMIYDAELDEFIYPQTEEEVTD